MTTPAWCARLVADLDAADALAVGLVSGLSADQLNWKPSPVQWSVGQCLEHLCLANEVYVAPITEALQRKPSGPVNDITPGWFGRWFLRSFIEPNTQRKRYRAPRKAAPITKAVDASILERFLSSDDRIRELIVKARDHDVNRVRFRNPFLSLVRFTVGTGFLILTRHNHRHLLQAQRVIQTPGFPT